MPALAGADFVHAELALDESLPVPGDQQSLPRFGSLRQELNEWNFEEQTRRWGMMRTLLGPCHVKGCGRGRGRGQGIDADGPERARLLFTAHRRA